MKFIPAPLESDIKSFSAQLQRLLPYYKRFSIDIQDGKVEPTISARIDEIVNFLLDKQSMFQDVTFDFDLMIEDYEGAIQEIVRLSKSLRIGNIVILSSALKNDSLPVEKDLVIGLSLNPQDTVVEIDRLYGLNNVPCMQIMTVHAGAQGQDFIADMLNKIDQLRQLDYRNIIYIDGAVNKVDIPTILSRKNLPDFACVGSFLTRSGDELEERVEYLKSVENEQM